MPRLLPFDLKKRESQKKRNTRTIVVFFALLFAILFLSAYVIVRWSGVWLVQHDEFEHIPWVLVLDGQTAEMERTDYAAALLSEGKADSALVLGRRVYKSQNNADFYIEEMLNQGKVDASRIFAVYHDDPSTIEEAKTVIPILKERAIDSVLLLTRGPATKRVLNIFEKLSGKGIVFLVQDAPDLAFNENTWVHTREGRKIWLKEWFAYIVSKLEILGTKIVEPLPTKIYPIYNAASASKLKSIETLPTLDAIMDEAADSILKDSSIQYDSIIDSLKLNPAPDIF
ncbi:MAG: YdcF family protein [Fibrobacter sp.]|nr:YdcF family protein [Fibrobacter sp.]